MSSRQEVRYLLIMMLALPVLSLGCSNATVEQTQSTRDIDGEDTAEPETEEHDTPPLDDGDDVDDWTVDRGTESDGEDLTDSGSDRLITVEQTQSTRDIDGEDTAEEPVEAEYRVDFEADLALERVPLQLARLDAAMGADGRIYFSGLSGDLHACSFDGGATSRQELDLHCERFGSTGHVLFYPRIAVSDAQEPAMAVVWDLGDHRHTLGRYSERNPPYEHVQTLFEATETTVNHPDVTFFDDEFVAVSQWFNAIGRVTFSRLPQPLTHSADWDACSDAPWDLCPGGFRSSYGHTEHKGPAVDANRMGDAERMAWVSFYGAYLFVHVCDAQGGVVRCSTDALDPGSFDAERDLFKLSSTEGYVGWAGLTVDHELNVHVAWNNSVEENDQWLFRGLDYARLSYPDLTPLRLHTPSPPLGDVGGQSPSVAVNRDGDVLVACSSNQAQHALYALFRFRDHDSWVAEPQVLASGKTGTPYSPAVVGYERGFWLLYSGPDDVVHVMRVRKQ